MADIDRASSQVESQLPGAAENSHSRPVAAARGQQLQGELKINEAILERAVIEMIPAHLALDPLPIHWYG